MISFILIPKGFLKAKNTDNSTAKELLHFSKWNIGTNIIGILQMQAGFYFVGFYKGAPDVGIFSSAWNLAFGLDLLVFSMLTVFLPKVSKYKSREEFIAFVKQTLKVSLVMMVILSPIYFFADTLVLTIYSDKYQDTILVFQIMFIGTLISLPAHPISLILLSLNKPQIFTYVGIFTMILTCIGNVITVPEHSAVGAAYVTSIMKVFNGVVLMWACYVLMAAPKQTTPATE